MSLTGFNRRRKEQEELIKKELEEIGIKGNSNSKKELVESYINTFKINFDDDTDEEVK